MLSAKLKYITIGSKTYMGVSTLPRMTALRIQISESLSVCLWPPTNRSQQPCFGLLHDEYIQCRDGRKLIKKKHQVFFGPQEFQYLVKVYELLMSCSQCLYMPSHPHQGTEENSNYYSYPETGGSVETNSSISYSAAV